MAKQKQQEYVTLDLVLAATLVALGLDFPQISTSNLPGKHTFTFSDGVRASDLSLKYVSGVLAIEPIRFMNAFNALRDVVRARARAGSHE